MMSCACAAVCAYTVALRRGVIGSGVASRKNKSSAARPRIRSPGSSAPAAHKACSTWLSLQSPAPGGNPKCGTRAGNCLPINPCGRMSATNHGKPANTSTRRSATQAVREPLICPTACSTPQLCGAPFASMRVTTIGCSAPVARTRAYRVCCARPSVATDSPAARTIRDKVGWLQPSRCINAAAPSASSPRAASNSSGETATRSMILGI